MTSSEKNNPVMEKEPLNFVLKGIGASVGVAIGRAYLVDRSRVKVVYQYLLDERQIEPEKVRFREAVAKAGKRHRRLQLHGLDRNRSRAKRPARGDDCHGRDNRQTQPSQTTRRASAVVTGSDKIENWKKKLSRSQIDNVLRVVQAFGLGHLYGDSTLPLNKNDW